METRTEQYLIYIVNNIIRSLSSFLRIFTSKICLTVYRGQNVSTDTKEGLLSQPRMWLSNEHPRWCGHETFRQINALSVSKCWSDSSGSCGSPAISCLCFLLFQAGSHSTAHSPPTHSPTVSLSLSLSLSKPHVNWSDISQLRGLLFFLFLFLNRSRLSKICKKSRGKTFGIPRCS